MAYLRALLERGLTIDEAAGQIMFGFSMGANFFLQIAKLRALRPLWAQIVEAFGGSQEAQRMHIHARPALFFKTVYDPYVNMLRNTTEIFSGVVGGVDSFESSPFDEPIRKGDEFSRRIARNVQIILQEEFGLLQPIDPAGGSWAVETLTKQMKEKIWAEFQVIEGKGGMLAALQEGYPQSEIAAILASRFKASETRKDRIVGNNMYPNMTEASLDPRPEDLAGEQEAAHGTGRSLSGDIDEAFKAEKLAGLDKEQRKAAWKLAIEAARLVLPLPKSLMPSLVQRRPEAEEVTAIAPHRWSERFEALRKTTEDYKAEHGENVKIFLANMGPNSAAQGQSRFHHGLFAGWCL